MSSWAHSVESFPLSRVLPLYHCSLACKSVGTIVYARGGFGGHILSGRYQSFIPACNSTTVKGEMARLGRTADRFPEKLKCQTFEWKTDLCRHHVDQPPPLMLSTIPVHYYCVLPWKMNQRARARIARQSGGQCMLKSFSGFKTSINVISAMNSSCI